MIKILLQCHIILVYWIVKSSTNLKLCSLSSKESTSVRLLILSNFCWMCRNLSLLLKQCIVIATLMKSTKLAKICGIWPMNMGMESCKLALACGAWAKKPGPCSVQNHWKDSDAQLVNKILVYMIHKNFQVGYDMTHQWSW